MNFASNRIRAVVAAAVLGSAAALQMGGAFAESPPNPPSRFVGSVKVNGQNAAAGTTVEAHIGSTTCGVSTVFTAGGEARYVVDSPALDPGATPNCGTDGAVVTFTVGGAQANETGTWKNYQLNTVNLTVTQATTTPAGGTPAAATPTTQAGRTPGAPASGNSASSGTGADWTWIIAGATATLGLGAVALKSARRS